MNDDPRYDGNRPFRELASKLSTHIAGCPRTQDGVLFIHGLGCSKEDFQETLALLPSKVRNLSFLAVDLPGFGDSPAPSWFDHDILSYARVLECLISTYGWRRVHLVGHSMGGGVALALGPMLGDRWTSIVSVEGNLVESDCGLMSRRIARTAYRNLLERDLPRLIERLHQAGMSYLARSFSRATPWALWKSANSLVEWSKSGRFLETFVGFAGRRLYVYGMNEPKAEVLGLLPEELCVPVPGAGHFVMRDRPGRFSEICREFLMSTETDR